MTAAQRVMDIYSSGGYGNGYTTRFIATELQLPVASVRRVYNELSKAGKLMRNAAAPALILPVPMANEPAEYATYGE